MTRSPSTPARRSARALIAASVTSAIVVAAPALSASAQHDGREGGPADGGTSYQWPVGETGHGSGAVTWSTPQRRGASFASTTRWWGAAGTLITIEGPRAPHRFPFRLDLPPDSRLRLNDHGEVVAWRHGRRIGLLGKPWAENDRGKRIKTWYSVHGQVVTQHVPFGRHARFPLTADPWWNPFTWQWDTAFSVAWSQVRDCGSEAVRTMGLVAGPTSIGNILLKHVAGRAAVMVPGGAYAYAALGVYGCLGSFF